VARRSWLRGRWVAGSLGRRRSGRGSSGRGRPVGEGDVSELWDGRLGEGEGLLALRRGRGGL
jgi:hypothetical protein